jgi:hypothetical protein
MYAAPVQLTPHSETEIKPGTSTPGTPGTPGTTDTPKPRPRLRTKMRSTTPKPPVKKPTSTPPSTPTPGTSTPDQTRTVTWQTFPDGSIVGDKQYTDWRDVE